MAINMNTGTPVNTKSLAAFLCNQMVKLDNGDIDANQAIAQAKLASQVNNLMNYELKRTLVQIKLKEIGEVSVVPALREIESKAFDDTIH